MKLNLSELRRLEEAATEGPWYWCMSENPPFQLGNEDEPQIGIAVENTVNASFIATSRNHFRQLLDVVESQKKIRIFWDEIGIAIDADKHVDALYKRVDAEQVRVEAVAEEDVPAQCHST